MKQVSVYLPERIYRILEKMRDEKVISSISEFIRNIVILTIFQLKKNRESEMQKQKTQKTKHYKHRSKKAYTLNKQVKNSPLFQKRKKKSSLSKADVEPQQE